ncbi:MAG: FkbM family methyltransferase [Solirubrobacterales bacterium]
MSAHLRKARKAAVLSRTPRWRAALRHGVAATIEHADVDFGDDFKTVLDVGGHHGQFTLFALERFPDAQITTFEPQADGAEKITAVTAGEPRVKIENYALGAEPGSAELNISRRSDSSSLLPIGKGQTDAFPGTEAASTETIKVETLDNLLPDAPTRPALLKIDVQGFELDVLRGATRTLAGIDAIFAECSFVELYEGQPLVGEIIAFLAGHDFAIAGVFGVNYDSAGRCLQADFLFRRA